LRVSATRDSADVELHYLAFCLDDAPDSLEGGIYRPIAKGPARMMRLYAMRSIRGVIATARTMDALADLARRERWVATYRHVDANRREVWVSIPE
jgi:hypothetical protein